MAEDVPYFMGLALLSLAGIMVVCRVLMMFSQWVSSVVGSSFWGCVATLAFLGVTCILIEGMFLSAGSKKQ